MISSPTWSSRILSLLVPSGRYLAPRTQAGCHDRLPPETQCRHCLLPNPLPSAPHSVMKPRVLCKGPGGQKRRPRQPTPTPDVRVSMCRATRPSPCFLAEASDVTKQSYEVVSTISCSHTRWESSTENQDSFNSRREKVITRHSMISLRRCLSGNTTELLCTQILIHLCISSS